MQENGADEVRQALVGLTRISAELWIRIPGRSRDGVRQSRFIDVIWGIGVLPGKAAASILPQRKGCVSPLVTMEAALSTDNTS